MNHKRKPGRPTNEEHICSCCNKLFKSAAKKCQHEYKQRSKKARTEVGTMLGDRDPVKDLDDFGVTTLKVSHPTPNSLKRLPTANIQSKFSAFFKPTIIDGTLMLASSLGLSSNLSPTDIQMEKESSSEEVKSLQGQGSFSNSFSQISKQEANESIEDLVKQLDKRQAWLQIEELVRLKTFRGLSKLPPSRDLFFSFFIQCNTLSSYPSDFAPALALAYKWINEHNFIITSAVTSQYSKFFEKYKPHKGHNLEDLETLFKFCRAIQAPLNWLHLLKDPELLMGEKAVLTGCCTSLRLLFECKTHYSHEYFTLVDYVIGSKLAGPSVDGFVKMLKLNAVQIDKPWTSLFQQYASIENTYTKPKTMKIGGQIFGVVDRLQPCSLLMDIVELAINLNKCEQIKAVIKSNLPFENIQEFQGLLDLQLEKDKFKAEHNKQKEEQIAHEAKRQYEVEVQEEK